MRLWPSVAAALDRDDNVGMVKTGLDGAFEANDDAIVVGKRNPPRAIDEAVGAWKLARYSASGLDCSFGRHGLSRAARAMRPPLPSGVMGSSLSLDRLIGSPWSRATSVAAGRGHAREKAATCEEAGANNHRAPQTKTALWRSGWRPKAATSATRSWRIRANNRDARKCSAFMRPRTRIRCGISGN